MTTSPVAGQVDVLIVGAGIAGIGAAHYLATESPGTSYLILESRDQLGGTWDLFRYPGIRSDSDLFTLGYQFKPWADRHAIAPAASILDYLRETAAEHGIDSHIRFAHRVTAISWSSTDARWGVRVERTDTGEVSTITANWVFGAAGYYRYDRGYTPPLAGAERFTGPIVHPQHWPEDLDYAGKRVVVIGSGATAISLVPALAEQAELVTMLQRTPSYVLPIPAQDRLANRLPTLIGQTRAYAVTRWLKINQQALMWTLARRFPRAVRRLIRRINTARLPAGYDVDTHFNPPYDPWHQRLCFAADGDLFRVIRDGSAEVVTDEITTLTESGLLLASGRELPADIIVTATGLDLQLLGGITVTVDDAPVQLADTVAYKGMMLSGVPNLVFAIGYINASWTLKVGLVCEHFTRLLAHMVEHGYDTCVPDLPDPGIELRPLLEFDAGYIRRAMSKLPKQGTSAPWRMPMRYADDVRVLRHGPVTDPALRFCAGARVAP